MASVLGLDINGLAKDVNFFYVAEQASDSIWFKI